MEISSVGGFGGIGQSRRVAPAAQGTGEGAEKVQGPNDGDNDADDMGGGKGQLINAKA